MRIKVFVLCAVFVTSNFFPVPAQAQSPSVSEEPYRAVLLQLIVVLQQQIEVLQSELAAREVAFKPSEAIRTESRLLPDSARVIAEYPIAPTTGIDDVTDPTHREYVERVYELFPTRYDGRLARFAVFSDSKGMFDAYVETLPPQHETWLFAVNEAALGEVGTEASDELIFHELAHLISYDTIAGLAVPATQDCHEYFARTGCLAEDMYLHAFTDTFWSDADLDRALGFSQDADPLESAYEYYERNDRRYVSDYAALSPEEDFAESFAVYVTDPFLLDGSLRSRKVWWFDQFSELEEIQRGY